MQPLENKSPIGARGQGFVHLLANPAVTCFKREIAHPRRMPFPMASDPAGPFMPASAAREISRLSLRQSQTTLTSMIAVIVGPSDTWEETINASEEIQ
jgi:hypothetical protein